jgi:hypothetical protein
MNINEPAVPDGSEIWLTLLAEPSSVVLAREMVRYVLTNWGYPGTSSTTPCSS